jgi:undecaprenyl-diphosphatase
VNPDTALFLAINGLARATGWLQPVVTAYASYGVLLFAALLLGGWWLARRRASAPAMAAALWAPAGMLLALGINQPVAALVGEPRPYTLYPGILVLAQRGTDPSFPSDHAVMAGSVTAALFLVSRRLGVGAALAAVLMAAARVYVGAHFPQDVVAGLLLGASVALGGFRLASGALIRLVMALEAGPVRPLLTGLRPGARSSRARPIKSGSNSVAARSNGRTSSWGESSPGIGTRGTEF